MADLFESSMFHNGPFLHGGYRRGSWRDAGNRRRSRPRTLGPFLQHSVATTVRQGAEPIVRGMSVQSRRRGTGPEYSSGDPADSKVDTTQNGTFRR